MKRPKNARRPQTPPFISALPAGRDGFAIYDLIIIGDVDPTDILLALDLARVVDKVKETSNRMSKVFTQLWPSMLDPWSDNVGALDLAMTIDALKGNAYPYHGGL